MAADTQSQKIPPEDISQNLEGALLSEFEEVDISQAFSRKSLDSLVAASNNSKKDGRASLGLEDLLEVVLQDVSKDIKIPDETIKKIKQSLDEGDSFKLVKFEGVVHLSPEVKKILIYSYVLAKREGSKVDNKHILRAYTKRSKAQKDIPDLDKTSPSEQGGKIPANILRFAEDITNSSSGKASSEKERVLESIVRILVRQERNNLILVGETGIGKSKTAHMLPGYIQNLNIGDPGNRKILSTDANVLFSQTNLSSGNTSKFTEEATFLPASIIFIDNVQTLNDSAQTRMLKDFLLEMGKNGNFNFILSTTPEHYNEHLASLPYFSKTFEMIRIEEATTEETIKIMSSKKSKLENHYSVEIQEDAMNECVLLSKRYLPGYLPQKAISLLEEACTKTSLASEKEVNKESVRSIVSQKTNIPLSSLSSSEKEKYIKLEDALHEYVIGQNEAVRKVSESLRRSRAGLKDPNKPIGSFLFLGPSGVGKTELAKTLAKVIFNDEKAFFRYDMSEYSEPHTTQKLIGSPPGYVGYQEGGQLTNPVEERPYCLLLFDEIEKAHSNVFDLFLQVIDDGRLTDSRGKTVDFRNTLIIYTSNIASDLIYNNANNLRDPSFDQKEFMDIQIMPIVRNYFRPEFINRFDDIVMFSPLSKEEVEKIARLKVNELEKRLGDKNIKIQISDSKLKDLVEHSYNPAYGARPLERAIKEQVENDIASKIISGEIKNGDTYTWQ